MNDLDLQVLIEALDVLNEYRGKTVGQELARCNSKIALTKLIDLVKGNKL